MFQELDEPNPDWRMISHTADLLMNQHLDAGMVFDWKYFLTNSIYRWRPEIFLAYQKKINAMSGTHFDLKPYKIGEPLRRPPLSRPAMIKFLKKWNGSYILE